MKKWPVAEIFTSIQGEGLYTGTLMTFIRFAGCSVGKKAAVSEQYSLRRSVNDPLPIYREKCTTYDGREFLCDTDFRTHEVLTTEEILKRVPAGVQRICLTGGEPLNQPLGEFMDFVSERTEYKVHIETSGTVSLKERWWNYCSSDNADEGWVWVTVSPKKGLLDEMVEVANEIKLLVDKDFDEKSVPDRIKVHHLVWIQPVNEEFSIDRDNLERCIKLMHEHPNWRLSMQGHKIWGVR